MTGPDMRSSSRRAVLAGTCAACIASLAGCARYGTNNGLAGPPAAPSSGSSTPAGGLSTAGGSGSGPAALAKTTDIPVGGGKILTAQKIVITQPTAGAFHAFTAICTHQGCIVDQVGGGTIDCPCHGSRFEITNGAVVAGPAPSPLPKKQIKIVDGQVVLLS
jgi:Rieske Fe-S protein